MRPAPLRRRELAPARAVGDARARARKRTAGQPSCASVRQIIARGLAGQCPRVRMSMLAERAHLHHCDREHSPRRRRVDSAAGAAARRAPRGTPSPCKRVAFCTETAADDATAATAATKISPSFAALSQPPPRGHASRRICPRPRLRVFGRAVAWTTPR
eukprot:5017212-Prymnesium_polylepis.2